MVKTHGLAHLAICVRDPERSFRFYEAVFGVVATWRDQETIQFQTPGTREAIVLQRDAARAAASGGVALSGSG